MKKSEVVKSNIRFNQILNNKHFVKNKYYAIYIMKSEKEKPHFGIAVSKKYGTAVERNQIKRRIRVLISEYKLLFPNYCDYIIMIRKECKNILFKELKINFKDLVIKEITNEEKNSNCNININNIT